MNIHSSADPTSPPTRDGPHPLLTYNAEYRILICLQCRYAIQKSAVESHLLRHKIYRQEKQHLLASISKLQLLDPHLVSTPPPSSKPIDGLEIIDGLGCPEIGCAYLCASEKRMKGHLGNVHPGLGRGVGVGRKVRLQTFFKGTKIRYFELSFNVVEKEAMNVETLDRGAELLEEAESNDAEMLPPTRSTSSPAMINLDLETLNYFYHFISSTISLLPKVSSAIPNYWEKEILPRAQHHHGLMSGLLAISAYHLAFLAGDDNQTKRRHMNREGRFEVGFQDRTDEEKDESQQIASILHLAKLSLCEPNLTQAPFNIHAFISAISKLITLSPLDLNTENEDITQAQSILRPNSITKIPPHHLEQLNTLPNRIAEKFPNPQSSRAEGIFSVLFAIASLITCCDRADNWDGMVRWVVSAWEGKFMQMVEDGDGAALVVVAYWATFLVKPTENDDIYWFLRGSSRTIVGQIMGTLDENVRDILPSREV